MNSVSTGSSTTLKGTALFTHRTGAVKCGGAPQKIMYLPEDWGSWYRQGSPQNKNGSARRSLREWRTKLGLFAHHRSILALAGRFPRSASRGSRRHWQPVRSR
jgi:hypothetical protein